MNEPTAIFSTQALIGAHIFNSQGKELGYLEELMIDMEHGTVAYAVLFLGSVLGSGQTNFAIPWQALLVDKESEPVSLTINKESLRSAMGSDPGEDDWPFLSNLY